MRISFESLCFDLRTLIVPLLLEITADCVIKDYPSVRVVSVINIILLPGESSFLANKDFLAISISRRLPLRSPARR